MLVVAYPEVFFAGGSLSPVGLNGVVDGAAPGPREVRVYPNVGTRAPRDDVRDIGARVWQLVPATKFVHRAIADGQSPFWNPYSAGGSYGTETLADIKLSPFVLAVALLGASATAFTFVALGFALVALYCLQQLFVRTLGTGRLAATGACVVWLLCGFGASDLGSQAGAPFVLFPVVLYALCEWHRRGGVLRLGAAIAAYAAVLATTFVPVQLLVLATVHVAAFVIDERRGGARATLLRHVSVPVAALAVTAYIWLPDLRVVLHGGSDISSYGTRSASSKGMLASLKLVSPWAVDGGPWIGYVGIATPMLVAGALPRARGRTGRLLVVTAVGAVVAAGLHLGMPPFSLLAHVPGLRSIRPDYWAAMCGAGAALALGAAVDVVRRRGVSIAATVAGGIAIVAWIGVAWGGSALAGRAGVRPAGVAAALVLVVLVAAALGAVVRRAGSRRVAVGAAVALLAIELLSYENHSRLARVDVESRPPAYVTFLRARVGDGRILDAGRGALYPEWGAVFGIPQVDTLDISQLPPYRSFYFRNISGSRRRGLFLEIGSNDMPFLASPSALDLVSVRYVVVDSSMPRFEAGVRMHYPLAFDDARAGVRVYANPAAFPRAFVVHALAPAVAGGQQAYGRYVATTADARLRSDAIAAHIAATPSLGAVGGTATVTRVGNTAVDVAVDTPRAGVLVLGDAFQRDWHAEVNGSSAHVGAVDDVVRGVVVPAGRSTVTFRYRSPARVVGGAISLAALVLLSLGGAWRVVTRRRSRSEAAPGRKDEDARGDEGAALRLADHEH